MKLTKKEKKQSISGSDGNPAAEIRTSAQYTPKKKYGKYILISALILFSVLAVYGVYSYSRPGPYDNLAKCLNEKGAVMYGALGWCKYTQAQKAMFGNSFKYLNYKEHTELPGIKKTPTWVINGMWYENVQTFDKLSELTGCEI